MSKLIKYFFLISFLLISCAPTTPTYSRQYIEEQIKNLCKKEFNIEVKVWQKIDTIWVYAPFEDILEEGKIKKDISENLRRIYLALARIILSMENRPKFYCFLISDIKNGYDIYYVWAIIDYIRLHFNDISLGEFNERNVFIPFQNILAINDREGKHVNPYNITMEEFISYLVRQAIVKKFTSEELKNYFKINDLSTNFTDTKLTVKLDIIAVEYKAGLPDPFEETKKIIKKFLKIYESDNNISEIEISDKLKSKIYSKKVLLEEK